MVTVPLLQQRATVSSFIARGFSSPPLTFARESLRGMQLAVRIGRETKPRPLADETKGSSPISETELATSARAPSRMR
ncbi:unnamed protein product [Chondrus crispus]|uniref:Uncharacterized protein n=1 Tax=Chondrus crispus TaxID=2769 RepID=R7Q4P6_CHOCR|nr:unnamed protein product [Chondrus crispus]CDF32351.1 unnamed protein product [Chondrus crispus]|eukprot:XP_005712016.1 unnamed protein product [Chondrus crispus]